MDEKSAERRFKLLINQSKHLPLAIKNFINRLEDNWERATNYMRFDFLPKTNNQLECL
ncbi:MAG: IS66 family transposase [Methanobrevibacter sp.]|nr:IS66 family transposase [Candidatus Methanovirga australis]